MKKSEKKERKKKRKRLAWVYIIANLLTPVLRLSLFSNEYAMTH